MSTSENVALIAWLNSRLTLDVLTTARTMIVDDLVSSVLLAAVSSANTSHLDARPDLSQQHIAVGSVSDEMRRPAAVSSLARSLGIPRETARGKAQTLVARGLVRATDEGLIICSDAMMADPVRSASADFLQSMSEFIHGLARLGVFGLDDRWRFAGSPQDVGWGAQRLLTAHLLRSVVHITSLSPDVSLSRAYVMLSVTHETGAHLMLDGAPFPAEALGRPRMGPVRGAAVAAGLKMPQETVRRHLQALVRSGRLRVSPAGYAIEISEGRLPLWREYQAQSVINTRQFIWKLRAAGIILQD